MGREEGSILVLALLVTLILFGVGLTSMWMAQQQTNMSATMSRRSEAYRAAKSGIERAEILLSSGSVSNWATLLNGCTGLVEPVDEAAVKGQYLCAGTDQLVDEPIILSGSTSASKAPGSDDVTYTIWIRNDDEEGIGNPDNDNRIVIRSEGRGRDGVSFVALESVYTVSESMGVDIGGYSQMRGGSEGASAGKGFIQSEYD